MLVIQQTIDYVASAPNFSLLMGIIVGCSMFLGATAYNGDIGKVMKWLVTTIPYTTLMIIVNISRIHSVGINNQIQAYAGTITTIIVSAFYFLGMYLGVASVRLAHWLVNRKA